MTCLSPNTWGASVWQSGGGLAVDDSGNLFAITGNGATYNGINEFSQTVLKLDKDLNVLDWFTPSNWASMNINDEDFSGRPMLVPGVNLLIAGAKDHNLYGVDPTNMGHLGGSSQIFTDAAGGTGSWGIFSNAFFNGRVYTGDGWIFANTVSGANISATPIKTANSYAQPLTISGSCNGTANCIVWATTVSTSAAQGPAPATLRAFDANTLTELYNSDSAPANADTLGHLAKFAIPVVFDGHVYVATQDNKIQVYGVPLTIAAPPSPVTATSVNWLISPNIGTISSTGLYTAPATITTTQTVTITAVSEADWTKSASLAITLAPPVSVTVTPQRILLNPGQTYQFTSTVQNSSNSAVTWSPSGSISPTGLYTAPATITSPFVTVTATSVADPTKFGIATVILTTSSLVPPTGLVLDWTFDTADDAGGIAIDASGNSGNGTIAGPVTQVAGKLNQALSFDGATNYVTTGNNSATAFQNNVTIAAWIKTTNTSRYESVFSKFNSAGSGSGYLLRTNANGYMEFMFGGANVFGASTAVDTAEINDGQWHHIAAVVTVGQDVKFYVDDKLSSDTTINSVTGDAGANLTVGLNPLQFFGTYFTGTIDEVRLYNRALSAAEVDTVFLQTGGSPPPPVVSIAVTPSNPTVGAGATQQLMATGTYQDNSVQNITAQVLWSASNSAVAAVNGVGLVTGVGGGTTTISAVKNGVTGTTLVTVPSVTAIAVTPASPTMFPGTTQVFTATGTYQGSGNQTITPSSWTSSNTAVATIDTNGVVTAIAAGTTTISAVKDGVTGTTVVTVPALLSIAVTPGKSVGSGRRYAAIHGDGHLPGRRHAGDQLAGDLDLIEYCGRQHQRHWPGDDADDGNHIHYSCSWHYIEHRHLECSADGAQRFGAVLDLGHR